MTVVQALQTYLVKILAGVIVLLLLACVGLGIALYVTDQRADIAEKAVTESVKNHKACTDANTAWSGTVDFIQGALQNCVADRAEVAKTGRAAVGRVRNQVATLEAELATWRSQSTAAELLPQCRGVLELELCPELADY
jgi:hypothetical protein